MNISLIIIIILAIIVIYFLLTFNSLIRSNNKVKEAFSTMDVYLKKRWDLIPNIVEAVKGYATHEKQTLEEVTNFRSQVSSYDNLSSEEKLKTNEQVTTMISRVMVLAEAYPNLKANENFLQLQKNLTAIEDEIAQSRKYYNGTVRIYNNKVEMIPSNIVAKIIGYKSKPMFEASEEEKENVEVDLNV